MSWNDPCSKCGKPRYDCECHKNEPPVGKVEKVGMGIESILSKIENQMLIIPDESTTYQRGLYDAYLNCAQWLSESPATPVKEVERGEGYVRPQDEELMDEIAGILYKRSDTGDDNMWLDSTKYHLVASEILIMLRAASQTKAVTEPISLEDVREGLRHSYYKATGLHSEDSPYQYNEWLEEKIFNYKNDQL